MDKRSYSEHMRHYTMVARAIAFIRANAEHQPSLAEIADAVNISEYHLQRIFSAWAGISPKRFLQYLTKERAKRALHATADILTAALECGLSSPGRLHDLMISCEAMTPGEIKAKGQGVTVKHGVACTPFGDALIGWTQRGICYLAFCDEDCGDRQRELVSQWPAATIVRADEMASRLSERIFPSIPQPGKLHLVLRGTNFQIKVWEALINIGPGHLISYSTLAKLAGSPEAQRAVGSALAANKISFLIPCHRVIREDGSVGNYRWGSNRKIAMQAWEAAKYDGKV